MDQQLRNWTTAWHTIMDEELGSEENANIEARYSDPGSDFRLHFDFWRLSEIAQRTCFAMLPLGDQIAGRVLDNRPWETKLVISEQQAKHMLVKAIRDTEQLLLLTNRDSLPFTVDGNIQVLRGTTEELEALDAQILDDLWYEASESFYDLPMAKEYLQARHFLSETLFRASSFYEGVYHSLWPYVDSPAGLDPFANILRMRRSQIEWLKGADGFIIFYNDDETIVDDVDVTLQLNGRGLQNVTKQINDFIALKSEYHRKRGFPAARLQDVQFNIPCVKSLRLKRRPRNNPQGPDLVEKGAIKLFDGELSDPDYALFYDAQMDGSHTDSFTLWLQYSDGQTQRARRMDRAQATPPSSPMSPPHGTE